MKEEYCIAQQNSMLKTGRGMVWYGMVLLAWFGMVWYGVWGMGYGMAQYSMVWYGIIGTGLV